MHYHGNWQVPKGIHLLTLSHTYRRSLTPLQKMTFENFVTKWEIAHDEQFLHLPQCFHIFITQRCFQCLLLQISCMWERVNILPEIDDVRCQNKKGFILIFYLKQMTFENRGKRRSLSKQVILLFTKYYQHFMKFVLQIF